MSSMRFVEIRANSNEATFLLKRPASASDRRTVFLCLANQSTGSVGAYIIGINSGAEAIHPISGSNASISRDGDNITITFESTNIWSSGFVIAPAYLT